ncbi:MAG: hypothetical protein ACRETH_13145, partial [Steroidobacteraceae bacterium]
MEADFVDSSGVTHQQPLELLNPDKGLGIQTSLSVPFGNIGAALSTVAANTTAATSGTSGTGTIGTGTATTPTTTTPTSGSTLPTTTAQFAVSFDGARDLTPFAYGATPGILLSSHASAHDLSRSGGIQGQLTLTHLTGITGVSGLPDIQVSAESLSLDGSRHAVVASTPLNSDGTFTLYPLATNTPNSNSSNPVSYDLVIHGGGIATIIIKDILIPPTRSATVTSNPTSTTTTGTSTNPDTTPIQPANLVSVGTLIPRAASTYTANIATAPAAALPAGAGVAFYQTLAASGEVPYVIEASPIDPFNQVLASPQTLSAGTVDSGTYVSSGTTVTVVSAAPQEGAGTYQVAATAPLYA